MSNTLFKVFKINESFKIFMMEKNEFNEFKMTILIVLQISRVSLLQDMLIDLQYEGKEIEIRVERNTSSY